MNKNRESLLFMKRNLFQRIKAVTNDQQQNEDSINELVKMLPEKHKTNNKVLKQQQKILQNYISLKREFSNFGEDGSITSEKLKGHNYKPLLSKLVNHENNKMYKPIVNESKKIYKSETLEDIAEEATFQINEGLSNLEEYLNLIKLKNKYKSGESELIVRCIQELNELYNIAILMKLTTKIKVIINYYTLTKCE